jgi:hypothetical protein
MAETKRRHNFLASFEPARFFAVVAFVLAGVSAWNALAWRSERADLRRLLDDTGVNAAAPSLFNEIETEATPIHGRLVAARALVYRVISANAQGLATAEKSRVEKALPQARELARQVLAEQPNSWQAAMLLGTSTYLERALAQDRKLYTEAAAWEKPLAWAVAEAGGRPEPRRLLASAYLEVWTALSPAKKQRAQEILGQVFQDDLRAYRALLPAWLVSARDFDQALEIIPSEPAAWDELLRLLGQRRAWRPLAEAHRRRNDSLEQYLAAQLDDADRRIRLGDQTHGQPLLLRALAEMPPSARFAPFANRALSLLLARPTAVSTTQLRAWLDYVLALDRVGIKLLEPQNVDRLVLALGEVEPQVGAHAAVVAEDSYQAERFSRLIEVPQLEAWAPYLIAKARLDQKRGRSAEAGQALSQVYLGNRRQPLYVATLLAVARAGTDPRQQAMAQALAEEVMREQWQANDWRLATVPVLEFWPRRRAGGLTVEIIEAPAEGVVVEARLDGRILGLATVKTGDRLTLKATFEPTPHRLELIPLTVAEVVPAAVKLLP